MTLGALFKYPRGVVMVADCRLSFPEVDSPRSIQLLPGLTGYVTDVGQKLFRLRNDIAFCVATTSMKVSKDLFSRLRNRLNSQQDKGILDLIPGQVIPEALLDIWRKRLKFYKKWSGGKTPLVEFLFAGPTGKFLNRQEILELIGEDPGTMPCNLPPIHREGIVFPNVIPIDDMRHHFRIDQHLFAAVLAAKVSSESDFAPQIVEPNSMATIGSFGAEFEELRKGEVSYKKVGINSVPIGHQEMLSRMYGDSDSAILRAIFDEETWKIAKSKKRGDVSLVLTSCSIDHHGLRFYEVSTHRQVRGEEDKRYKVGIRDHKRPSYYVTNEQTKKEIALLPTLYRKLDNGRLKFGDFFGD